MLRRARASVAFRRTLSHPAWRYHRLLRGGNDAHNAPACAEDFTALALALGWGGIESTAFADRLDAIAEAIGLRAQLSRTAVPGDDIAPMARDAVAIRRLIDPNPRDVTEADAARIYRAVLHAA